MEEKCNLRSHYGVSEIHWVQEKERQKRMLSSWDAQRLRAGERLLTSTAHSSVCSSTESRYRLLDTRRLFSGPDRPNWWRSHVKAEICRSIYITRLLTVLIPNREHTAVCFWSGHQGCRNVVVHNGLFHLRNHQVSGGEELDHWHHQPHCPTPHHHLLHRVSVSSSSCCSPLKTEASISTTL